MKFCVLGPVGVVVDGRRVVLGATREAALLADLLVHAGQVVSAERLVEDLWRGDPSPRAAATLQTYVKNLRRVIEPGRPAGEPCDVLVTCRPGYVLDVEQDDVDAVRFERLVEEGRAMLAEGASGRSGEVLRDALALWCGPAYGPLAGEAFIRGDAARLEELRLVAVEERVQADLALGQHLALCAELEVLVTDHPYRERLWAQLMLALYRAGRQTDALRAYQRVRRGLAEDVGVEPGAELQTLEQAILIHDPRLNARDRGAGASQPVHVSWRRNLRSPLTGLVGRASAVATINERVRAGRLVTLTGVAGVGKTRLALHTAANVSHEQFPDGVWLFELAPVSDEAGVLSTLTAVFGLSRGLTDRLDRVTAAICAHLADLRMLLVLDNCEHVIEIAARLAEKLLGSCPAIHILATSREVMRVPGEVVLPVLPLPVLPVTAANDQPAEACDAAILFCERARNIRPDLPASMVTDPSVLRICRRLEGIPLALELAAARVRVLNVEQIADGLDDCVRLLGVGARTVDRRHQSLQFALDWSYELLSDPERAAFRQLAVFAADFRLDAAVSVLNEVSACRAIGGFELLSRLVDKSLVVASDVGRRVRYRLLEPIRQYATLKLAETNETEAAGRRHRDYWLAQTNPGRGRFDVVNDGPRVLADYSDYSAALEWSWQHDDIAAALCFVQLAGAVRIQTRDLRAREWLERVLAVSEPAVHPARGQALATFALLLQEAGEPDLDKASICVRDAMAIADRIGDAELSAWLRFTIGELELTAGHSVEARALLTTALHTYQGRAPDATVGWCHTYLGWSDVLDKRFDQAVEQFERAAALAAGDDMVSRWLAVHALAALAPLLASRGETDRAAAMADAALAAAAEFNIDGVHLMAFERAAEAALLAGAYDRTRRMILEALHLQQRQADRRWVADTLEIAALLLAQADRPEPATQILDTATSLRATSGEPLGGVRALADEVRRLSRKLDPGSAPPSTTTPPLSALTPTEAIALAIAQLHGPAPRLPAPLIDDRRAVG